jgi:serine/threonine protein kinase
LSTIGKGQFASVFRVRNKIDQCLYAVKKTTRVSRGFQESQLREVLALASIGIEAEACRNIVRYFSSWLEDGRLHIQTELCECSLRDRLAERWRSQVCDPRFSEDTLIEVLRDVSSGLAVLHARNFVHLDIKPDNILISRGPQGCYKIADLGLVAAAIAIGCDDISEGDCRYLAREVLRGDLSSLPKADVFALGLVVYELATNPKTLPCNGDEWQLLRTGRLDTALLPPLSEPFLALLHAMVHPMPSSRPSCEEVFSHPSLAELDELEVLEEAIRQRTLEAERNRQLAEEYRAEILSLKRQETSQQPFAAGRPVAQPRIPQGSLPGHFEIQSQTN